MTLAPSTDLDKFAATVTPRTRLFGSNARQSAPLDHRHRRLCGDRPSTRCAVGIDSTFATPVLTRPLELGADIVMHSATKYLGGHSDVLGGALVVMDKKLREQLYFIQNATGAVMAPLESFLCSRGLKTLELRVHEHCRTAARVAEFLASDRRVRQSSILALSIIRDTPWQCGRWSAGSGRCSPSRSPAISRPPSGSARAHGCFSSP